MYFCNMWSSCVRKSGSCNGPKKRVRNDEMYTELLVAAAAPCGGVFHLARDHPLASGIAPPPATVVSNLSKSGAARFSANRPCEA